MGENKKTNYNYDIDSRSSLQVYNSVLSSPGEGNGEFSWNDTFGQNGIKFI